MAKKYDIVAKIGEYHSNGETKNRYLNVGAVMTGEHGPYMLLNKTFNPAGVPGDPNKDSILLSLFEPRSQEDRPQQQEQHRKPTGQKPALSPDNPYANRQGEPVDIPKYEDDIPF